MVRKDGRQSLAVGTFERLQGAILAGAYQAGERLLPAALATQYGVSTSVIREALIRLSERDLVEVLPNKGFMVSRAGADRLRDLIEVRIVNEAAALRLAIARGDIEWESAVVAAHHRLAAIDMQATDFERWFVAHLAFHEQLIAGCGNAILTRICADLLRNGDLYLRWFLGSVTDVDPWSVLARRDHAAEHRGILDAVLARDPDLAVQRYEAHLRLTGELIDGMTSAIARKST